MPSRGDTQKLERINQEMAELLKEANCLKFGQFKLKSGTSSSYYIDLRNAPKYPTLHAKTIDMTVDKLDQIKRHFVGPEQLAVVGVPYGSWPTAAVAAYKLGLPFYPIRKETKDYGSQVDTSDFKDYAFVLVEDVMSSGSSIVETIEKLKGAKIVAVIVMVDREQGGEAKLADNFPQVECHSLLRVSNLLGGSD